MKHDGLWKGDRRRFLGDTAKTVIPAILISSCGDNQGTFESFRVKQFSCTKLSAENGETITLNWDYGRPELLKMQKLRFLRLHLSGIAQEVVDIDLEKRSFEFQFSGPITVEIQATTEAVSDEEPFSPRFSAALNVKKLQDLFFRGIFQSASNTPQAPYLGYPSNSSGEAINQSISIDFTQFAGFFDSNLDGRINPLTTFLPTTEAFRGLSITGVEAQQFGYREGPNFPFQSFSNPGFGRTNGIIFAGAIAMNGETLPYKADDGDGSARVSVNTGQGATTAALGFDPIFVAIPFLDAGGQLVIADIQVGNLNQRLVTTVFTNPLLLSTSSIGSLNEFTVNRNTSLSRGNVKGATSGLTITPADGTGPFDALVAITSLEWQTEYMSDEDILNVLTIG